jgi:hypothetical protein
VGGNGKINPLPLHVGKRSIIFVIHIQELNVELFSGRDRIQITDYGAIG